MADPTVVTSKYGTIITAIGKAKITAAVWSGKKVNITLAAVGDGGGAYYKPTEDQTDLIRECWRGAIASYAISESNPNMIDIKFIVPADVTGFTVREAKVIDDEGDTIAIWNTPEAERVDISEGASFPLTMMSHILVEDASAVTVTVNPALDTVSREEMEAAIESALADYADKVGSAIVREDFTIPIDGWVSVEEGPEAFEDYKLTIDVALAEAKDEHSSNLALATLKIAAAAELCPTNRVLDGYIRFWANEIPEAAITGTLTLRSENLIDLDTATDEEVNDTVDGVFGETGGTSGTGIEFASDEEVEETVTGIFGEQAVNE